MSDSPKKKSKGSLKAKLQQVAVVSALLFSLWCAWLGWNNFVSIPPWIMFTAVFITKAIPGDPLFEAYVKVVDWTAANLLIPEPPNWELTILENWTPDDFSYDKLAKLSKGFTMPVIFRGLGRNISHLDAWQDPMYFAEHYGNTTLMAVRNPTVKKQREQALKAVSYGAGDSTGAFSANEVKLGDGIRRMMAGENVYFQNVDEFVRRNPEILEHMEMDKVFKNWKDGKPYSSLVVNWFLGFGGKGDPNVDSDTTGTSLHAAMIANLFFQYAGKKQWWFVEPRWTPYVLGTHSRHVPAGFARRLPDYVPKATAVLERGDVMFNPPYMWHEVRNFPGWSLAAANRIMFPYATISNNPVAYFLVDLFGHPFTFSRAFFVDKPIGLFVIDTPIIRTLALLLKGNAMETHTSPTQNNCDEHNMEACSASIEKALMGDKKFFEDMEKIRRGEVDGTSIKSKKKKTA